MAANKTLELSIKIAGKVDKSLIKALNTAQSNVSTLSTSLSKVGTAGLAAMGALATGTVTALAKCTEAAGEFEDSMANVVKYVGGLADKNGQISDQTWSVAEGGNGNTYAENYAEMSKALLDLSTQIPMTAEDLTKLAAAAGQSGKTMSDIIQYDGDGKISGFLKDVAMMGTAMDISAEQAGDWAAKWEKAFDIDHDQVMVLADQINYLGANNATTAAEIAQVVNEAAGLGQVAGMDVSATAALSTAMLAMGVDVGKSANAISRMYVNLSKGTSATKAQKEQWEALGFTAEGIAKSMQDDASGTILEVFEAIGNLDADKQVAALSTLFGQWAIKGAAKLTGNLDTFTDALGMVNDPSLYTGSMKREFLIKASTSGAVDTMMGNAFQAFKIDIGTAFLPAKKEISGALIDFMNQLRSMPELGQIAQQLATLFSQGVQWAGDALERALPYIQQALDYLINHGPEVVSVLGKLAAAFVAMKFAPGIESLLKGAGSLVFGSGAGGAGGGAGSAGILGTLGNIFRGGQAAGSALAAAPGNALTWIQSFAGATRETMGITGATGPLGFLRTAGSALLSPITNSGVGQYFGGIGSGIGNFLNQSGIAGAARGTVSVTGEILQNIAGATGLTDLVNGGINLARTGAGRIAGGVTTLAGNVVNSAPVQAVAGFAGNVINSAPVQGIASMASGAAGWAGNTISAGAGLLGNIWGPIAGGFGSLLSGALPVVGVISSIIAVLSILYDNLDGVRDIIGNVFGEKGLAVFDTFKSGLDGVLGFIQGIFNGGLADALAPVRDIFASAFEGDGKLSGLLNNIFSGQEGGLAAFDGAVQILQSLLGVFGQIVDFANTTVKPIIQEIFSFLTTTVIPIVVQTFTAAAPMISGIITNLGSTVMTVAQFIGSAIQAVLPIVENIISVIMSIASVVIPAILAAIEAFTAQFGPIIEGIQQVFQGLIDFITGVFTGNWEQAWNGVKEIFKGAFEALSGLIKAPINAVIALINKAISGINGLGLTIPDWVPVIGGKSFSINIPTIPMLARGGFTNGASIAGEAGREAVISFKPEVRSENIRTWVQAGQLLGVNGEQAAAAANISNVAYYADGGFTNGASVAGEAGREAVISFKPSVRSENIQTWIQAGQLLGASGNQAAEAANISNVAYYAGGGFTGGSTISNYYGGGKTENYTNLAELAAATSNRESVAILDTVRETDREAVTLADFGDEDDGPDWWPQGGGGGTVTITYAPTIVVQGNASKEDIDAALREDKARFRAWYEEMKRNERRVRY